MLHNDVCLLCQTPEIFKFQELNTDDRKLGRRTKLIE